MTWGYTAIMFGVFRSVDFYKASENRPGLLCQKYITTVKEYQDVICMSFGEHACLNILAWEN